MSPLEETELSSMSSMSIRYGGDDAFCETEQAGCHLEVVRRPIRVWQPLL